MPIIKVAILGDSECGKTSFTSRWTSGVFPDPEYLKTTVGASFDTKTVETPSNRICTLSIWDFGGQERFIEQLKSMVRGSRIGLLFFDVSYLQSLDNLISYWIPMIEENANLKFHKGDGARFILVGNKIDLLDSGFENIEKEMDQFSSGYGSETQLISAKTGVGMEQLDFKVRELVDKFMD